ncbi:MAG: heme ABC transporter ATP-binding protein [Allorhizobium sp.]
MIRARNIAFVRSGRTIIAPTDITIDAGRLTVIVGPNGAGKSTLMKLLCGEISASEGLISYGGRDIRALSAGELAQRRAVLPQTTTLSFPFTVLEVVRMGAVANGSLMPTQAARDALAKIGLEEFEARQYRKLSGGEQQRVQFARALAQVPDAISNGQPRALFLDEPTASLDLRHQIAVLETARGFARDGGAVLAILHDLNLAAEFADHLLIMADGRVVSSGPPQQTIQEDVIARVYGIQGAVGQLPAGHIPFVLSQARSR